MKNIAQHSMRESFVVIVTLVLLLVMTTMGIGLFYETKKTAKQVSVNIDKRSFLHASETCVTEAVRWLRGNSNSCNVTDCQTFGAAMNEWADDEAGKRISRMERTAYSCTISRIGQEELDGNRIKSYYKILSNGYDSNQPDRNKTTIEVIVSIEL